jgi:hypothetical protein
MQPYVLSLVSNQCISSFFEMRPIMSDFLICIHLGGGVMKSIEVAYNLHLPPSLLTTLCIKTFLLYKSTLTYFIFKLI